jgi:hypothetical protein
MDHVPECGRRFLRNSFQRPETGEVERFRREKVFRANAPAQIRFSAAVGARL